MTEPRNPGAPADLDTIGKADWRKIRAHIEARGDWCDEYRHVLGQTVRHMQLARNAWDGWHDPQGRAVLTVPGSKDQDVTNPAIRVWQEGQRDALKGLKELCLTPLEAAKAGVQAKTSGPGKFGLD